MRAGAQISSRIEHQAKEVGYGSIQRHIFLCIGGKCASDEFSQELWQYLKKRLKECDAKAEPKIQRSKADCLRICLEGPIVLVYPEAVLYSNMTKDKLERIIQKHLLAGIVVEDWALYISS